MPMKEFDVVVVGGGPGGVSAAKFAAKEGLNVLLLEKEPAIMAWKPCGEATSKETLETAGIGPKPSIVLKEAYAQVYAPNMKFIEIKQIGYSINKSYFLQEIAADAAAAGAEIHVREAFEDYEFFGDYVKVKTSKDVYRAKVIIGSDGYNSKVAKAAGITEKSEPIPTVQYVMANVKLEYPDAVRFFLGNEIAPKGYAWIFPKSDKIAEVGIGVRGAPAKVYLDKFVKMFEKELGKAQVIDYRGAPVPIGGMIKDNIRDGLILIGDAAGTVIPFTGAGIHSSIAAGRVVARVVARAIEEGDVSARYLSSFRKEYYEPWGRRIERSLKAMRAFENLTDEELNTLQEILGPEEVLDLANGFDLRRVAVKLLQHPVLAVKLAKRLL